MKKLLGAKIPVEFIDAVHQEVMGARRNLETRVRAKREATPQDKPAFGSIKDRYGAPRGSKDQIRNRDQVSLAEEKALAANDDYPDKGMYSASRELALLGACFKSGGDDKQMMEAAVRGKAIFDSHELSESEPGRSGPTASSFASEDTAAAAPEAHETSDGIARTPEEIRRKLEARQSQSTGKAAFAATDIEPVVPQDVPRKPPPPPEPEPAPERPTGKATFASRDIEPIAAQEAPRKPEPKPEPEPEPIEPERPSGKAIFESRDLSSPSPTEKDEGDKK